MNRINELFETKKNKILSIFCTAGYPQKDSIISILQELQNNNVDMVEIGMPFSDPTADGPVIQYSNNIAISNGMTLNLLFEQLKDIRKNINMPIILMGYLNPAMQFGIENFLSNAANVGVDGIIIPDLPLFEYQHQYKELFEKYNLKNIFLITPQTSEERIREIDAISDSFIYAVSTFSITGSDVSFSHLQDEYFARLKAMQLKNPIVMGFGIKDKSTLEYAHKNASGGIIGSAFVKMIENSKDYHKDIKNYIATLN